MSYWKRNWYFSFLHHCTCLDILLLLILDFREFQHWKIVKNHQKRFHVKMFCQSNAQSPKSHLLDFCRDFVVSVMCSVSSYSRTLFPTWINSFCPIFCHFWRSFLHFTSTLIQGCIFCNRQIYSWTFCFTRNSVQFTSHFSKINSVDIFLSFFGERPEKTCKNIKTNVK